MTGKYIFNFTFHSAMVRFSVLVQFVSLSGAELML